MPAHSRVTALVLAAALAACGDPPSAEPAPLDRFTFPIALELVGQELLVVSSNFDLAYGVDDGGSVISVDVAGAPAALRAGGVRIPSFAGELAVADAGACGLPATLALVTSREGNALHRLAVGPGGALACGEGCRVALPGEFQDPYGVGVVCRGDSTGAPPRARAYVGFLRTPQGRGRIAELDLRSGELRTADVGVGAVRSFAYDETNDRLYFTSVESGASAPLRWLDLAGDCRIDESVAANGCRLSGFDLSEYLRGLELRGIALSNPQPGRTRRAFVAGRIYNADLAATIGGRPAFDVGGVLLVLELVEGRSGVEVRFVARHEIGLGANEVQVLPVRPGQGDVVAVTATDAGALWLYDDELGALVRVIERSPTTGAPLLGRKPFALAVRDDGASARLFVSSFEDGFVTPVDVPLEAPWTAVAPAESARFGGTP